MYHHAVQNYVMLNLRTHIKKETIINGLIVVTTLGFLYILVKALGGDQIHVYVEQAGPWAWLALILAKASTMIFAPLSGGLLYPMAGTLFGFWTGFVLVLIGDAIGGTVSFYISRRWGRTIVDKMLGEDSELVNKALTMMGTVRGFLVARVLMSPVPEVATYAAGLTRLPYLPFIAIHMAVDLLPVALLTGVGALILEEAHPLLIVAALGVTSIIGAGFVAAFMYYFKGTSLKTAEVAAPDSFSVDKQ